jgi:hypothetical protein
VAGIQPGDRVRWRTGPAPRRTGEVLVRIDTADAALLVVDMGTVASEDTEDCPRVLLASIDDIEALEAR